MDKRDREKREDVAVDFRSSFLSVSLSHRAVPGRAGPGRALASDFSFFPSGRGGGRERRENTRLGWMDGLSLRGPGLNFFLAFGFVLLRAPSPVPCCPADDRGEQWSSGLAWRARGVSELVSVR